jgi:tRNA (mo5U34)-methyltransferase
MSDRGKSSVNAASLRAEVAAVRWFHTIDLGAGIVTRGIDDSPRKLAMLRMPERLDGRTVLDVGAWDGFFSFEAERRGAARVVAVDSHCWSGEGWGTRDGFDLARRILASKVEDRELEVLELRPETVGSFDLVLFLGVLYHMRYPLEALERVASVTANQLILETHVDLLHRRRPAMAFYPGRGLDGDPTNWWGPNPAALEAMLRDVGFTRIERVFTRSFARRAGRALKLWWKRGVPLLSSLAQGRVVYHAWK